ncbi:endonuclease/exonuclease/phosphatase family protein [Psychroserpens sp.]|uniref:endonuclease/exonuclease/phosphatase family protein n=1 Tax=Psychroserpens sp. TaxID=2020870 RepID=UPI001B00686F|nr:endonuclease/exonuclease/phosphatase family protein [Psychroserpens sp.]MBO6606347.1 endonuclease/exonuclease/phosphatase family protein [Psychroserpens sp.]MBO6653051.1 endonuclease/exonuclease/phosphatase family protein [Psychroserpens sp.]MBO6680921.1 endonuclease/exonuclease/phosphatase family protein [Psychroserpens sp.]MBO6750121.1 endonuclease/exonuclease/phosphatase family protein [Psychroserpens sp.]MBO6914602.1 endonuclease/exonuclease/phosphatase family protein [Psychroserpens sp
MRKLKGLEKLVYVINSLMAFALLLSYILPYFEPKKFAFLSVLSLAVPALIILNILFLIYWLLKVKRQLLLSLIVLAIGYNHVFSLYKFSSSTNIEDAHNLSVMNYNVRLFNVFNWIEDDNLKGDMNTFLNEKSPDIICMQEYRPDDAIQLSGYSKYEELSGQQVKNGQAIFTKYPIVNSGSIEFPNTSNNAIFADIVKEEDTIRIYNVHLQSSGIDPTVENLKNEDKQNLINRVSSTFKAQQSQAELFLKHKVQCDYPMVICGDFNNTAYSYVYKIIKEDLNDAFVTAGNGFGRTYDFKFFPVRIDFILVDEQFSINGFKTFDVKYSDHYPIQAKVSLNSTSSDNQPDPQ